MRAYELVTIVNPEVDADGLANTVDKVVGLITDRGGVVDEVSQWGKRKLAYPVQKFMEGNYVLTRFQMEAQLIKGLDTSLEGSGEILRHLIVRAEGR
jgi:small subunit ribosomal protein S6